MSPFRKLSVWRKAHALALRVHAATSAIPDQRYPGVADRLRQGSADIAAFIVEGTWCDSPRQFAQCLSAAISCARDLDYRLLLAADLGAIARTEHVRLSARIDQICRMLSSLRDTVENRRARVPAMRTPSPPS